jgi:hypothetical protein
LPSFAGLRDDGTTSSGNWLYSGSFTEEGNMMARRGTDDPSGMGFHHDWGVQLALEPAGALQPGFGRRRGPALGRQPGRNPMDRGAVDR